MSFSITLFQFDKKHNSTKLPIYGAGTLSTSCELKSVCSLLSPVVTFVASTFVENDNLYAPSRYTYAQISEFGRYYWITGWTWQDGIWAASMQVDPLATYKSAIGSSSQYVLRAASRYNNDLADSKYMTFYKSNRVSSAKTTISSPWKVSLTTTNCNTGFFVVGIVNNDQSAIGATSYYYFAPKSLRYFLGLLMAAPSWMNITDASLTADLQKIMFNPMQYIVSCMYIPMELPAAMQTQTDMVLNLPIGWWTIDVSGAPAMSIFRATAPHPSSALGFNLTVPRNPAAASRPYAKLSPYTEYALEFWPFGMIALDSTKLYGSDTLYVSVEVDFITGRGILYLRSGSGERFYETVSQVGIPVSVAQITLDRSTITSGTTWLMAAGLALAQNAPQSSKEDYMIRTDNMTHPPITRFKPLFGNSGVEGGGSSSFGYGYPEAEDKASSATESIMTTIERTVPDIVNSAIASAGSCNYQGQTGGFAQYTNDVLCIAHYCDLADEDIAQYGRPLCEVVTINTLSGFILCATGDVEVNAIKAERELISAYLTGGFYYE